MTTTQSGGLIARFGAYLTARRWRMAKRFGLVAGGTVSALSFLVVDLARKDAVFSVSFSEIDPDYPNSVVFDLMNFSNQTMTNAHIRFALYDAKGALIRGRNLDGNWGSIDDS